MFQYGTLNIPGMRNALALSFILGFVTASPIGPMGLLYLRRTLSRGFVTGVISALGISFADAFWSYAAIHGLTSFSHWIEQEQTILQITIGLFFILYGLHAIFNTPNTNYPSLRRKGRGSLFLSTFLVVFLNPSTFIMFSALFTLFGLTKDRFSLCESLEIAFMVFCGSILFWVAVSHTIHRMKRKKNEFAYYAVSSISSYLIMMFGIAILLYHLYAHLH
jgi:threonine/homoserine/homoserine lactone efflux protein